MDVLLVNMNDGTVGSISWGNGLLGRSVELFGEFDRLYALKV
jgi:hypothetical protein